MIEVRQMVAIGRGVRLLSWIAILLLLVSCASGPKVKQEVIPETSVEPEMRIPDSWKLRSAWLQYQAGRQAANNGDWPEAVFFYDLALSEFLVEKADSAFSMDSLYFIKMPHYIVQAMEEAFPKLSRNSREAGVAFVYDHLEDWQEEDEDYAKPDTAELVEIRSFLDTLDLSRFSLPMEINERVLQELHFLSTRVRSFTESSLGRMAAYEEMVLSKLRAKGMPDDLRFLALVESGYKPRAFSRAKAGGIWQFIPGTASRYGLKIDFWVDERRDPESATDAALRYLSDLYREFGDWNLAMAAYNCGEGRIRRQLRERGKVSYWEMNLPRETMHYVPRILAAAIIGHFPHKYGFNPVPQTLMESDTVRVTEFLPLDMAADALGISLATLRELNIELTGSSTPPGASGYALRIPAGTRDRFLAAYAKMDRSRFVRNQQHRVRSGETLGAIARQYGVSVAQLKSANGLSRSLLRVGQVLVVPNPGRGSSRQVSTQVPAQTPSALSGPPSGGSLTYTVRSGDNLFSIARKYGVSVSDLQSWNRLEGTSLRVGQNLRVRMPTANSTAPSASAAPPVARSGRTGEYIVQAGENPYSISRKLGVRLDDLLAWNELNRESRLQVGQRLIIRTALNSDRNPVRTGNTSAGIYVVRQGDSLWDIARRHGFTLQQLQEWNDLPDTRILPGQQLRLAP